MRSGGNNFNYFPENKLSKLANLVQFEHVFMSCLDGGGLGFLSPFPLSMPLNAGTRTQRRPDRSSAPVRYSTAARLGGVDVDRINSAFCR